MFHFLNVALVENDDEEKFVQVQFVNEDSAPGSCSGYYIPLEKFLDAVMPPELRTPVGGSGAGVGVPVPTPFHWLTGRGGMN